MREFTGLKELSDNENWRHFTEIYTGFFVEVSTKSSGARFSGGRAKFYISQRPEIYGNFPRNRIKLLKTC